MFAKKTHQPHLLKTIQTMASYQTSGHCNTDVEKLKHRYYIE